MVAKIVNRLNKRKGRVDPWPDLLKVKIIPVATGVTHNMPCAICVKKHAVCDSEIGFQPCWTCQIEGYKLVKKHKRRFWQK